MGYRNIASGRLRLPASPPILATISIDPVDWLRIQEFDDDNPGTVILDRDDPDHGRMTVYNGRKPWSANGVVGIVILPSGISSDRLKT